MRFTGHSIRIKTRKMFTSSPIPLNRNYRVRVTIETSAPARFSVFICDKAKPNTTVCRAGGDRTTVNAKDKEEETFFFFTNVPLKRILLNRPTYVSVNRLFENTIFNASKRYKASASYFR